MAALFRYEYFFIIGKSFLILAQSLSNDFGMIFSIININSSKSVTNNHLCLIDYYYYNDSLYLFILL